MNAAFLWGTRFAKQVPPHPPSALPVMVDEGLPVVVDDALPVMADGLPSPTWDATVQVLSTWGLRPLSSSNVTTASLDSQVALV